MGEYSWDNINIRIQLPDNNKYPDAFRLIDEYVDIPLTTKIATKAWHKRMIGGFIPYLKTINTTDIMTDELYNLVRGAV